MILKNLVKDLVRTNYSLRYLVALHYAVPLPVSGVPTNFSCALSAGYTGGVRTCHPMNAESLLSRAGLLPVPLTPAWRLTIRPLRQGFASLRLLFSTPIHDPVMMTKKTTWGLELLLIEQGNERHLRPRGHSVHKNTNVQIVSLRVKANHFNPHDPSVHH